MNSAEALRRLWKEKKEWQRMGAGPEVTWTLRGIRTCIRHIQDLLKEQRTRDLILKPKVNKWQAGNLFRAVRVARHYILMGDRARAIQVLEKAEKEAMEGRLAHGGIK